MRKPSKQYYSVWDNDPDPEYKGWAVETCPFHNWRQYYHDGVKGYWRGDYQRSDKPFKLELWQAKEWYRYLCVQWEEDGEVDGDNTPPPFEVRRILSKKEAAEQRRREKFAMRYL